MHSIPQPVRYRPAPAILDLGDSFYDRVEAATFPQATLRFRNDRAAATVGLAELNDEQWIAHFARFRPLPGNLPGPLALRYHGHQFRVYNPEIGDGRGFLFAQMRDHRDRLMDLGTKGSGQTPWSRFGDGRLTLKGGVREVLATEMLEALGVETSRSFSLIETGEALERGDEPSPTRSVVLVRLSHGHIRIGTFQRLAYLRDAQGLAALADYVLRHYYGDAGAGEGAPLRLLRHVVRRGARLAAQFMAAGFVHGVLNSDNINVTGESFDYGPWRFNPTWNPDFTAAYFDHQGLYAFGRQPEAIHWNVMQLAACFRDRFETDALIEIVDDFGPAYQDEVCRAILWRLGVKPLDRNTDRQLIEAIERGLRTGSVALDLFFHQSFGGTILSDFGDDFAPARALLACYAPRSAGDQDYWRRDRPCSMLIDEVEAIWCAIAERDDWRPFQTKVQAIREMGSALAA